MKIVVIDDSADLAAKWVDDIAGALPAGSEFELSALSSSEILLLLKTLRQRRASYRGSTTTGEVECILDSVDILVVDYELWELDPDQQISGEDLCYLARAYSQCGLIIGVNQGEHKQPTFDLTLREVHQEFFADVMMNGTLLGNPGLWQQPLGDTFRPWTWPNTFAFIAAFESNSNFIKGNLDTPVMNACGLTKETVERMTPREKDFFSPFELNENLTFRQIALSSVGYRGKDGDFPPSEEYIARIVSSRIMAWLIRIVTVEQEWLIDFPHLAVQCPEVFDFGAIGQQFHRLCEFGDSPIALVLEVAKPALWQSEIKLDRMVFNRQEVISSAHQNKLKVVATEFEALVFCEDASGFRPSSEAFEYLTDLEGNNRWRWVTNPLFKSINYQPKSALAV